MAGSLIRTQYTDRFLEGRAVEDAEGARGAASEAFGVLVEAHVQDLLVGAHIDPLIYTSGQVRLLGVHLVQDIIIWSALGFLTLHHTYPHTQSASRPRLIQRPHCYDGGFITAEAAARGT